MKYLWISSSLLWIEIIATTSSFQVSSPLTSTITTTTTTTRKSMTSSSSSSSSGVVVMDEPYGSWKSPITSKSITAGSVGIDNLNVIGNDIFWTELRPQEAGRNVLCQYAPSDENKNDRNALDVTPEGSNIRTLVHEYGGGALCFGTTTTTTTTSTSSSDVVVVFSDFATQNLCTLDETNQVKFITTSNNDDDDDDDGATGSSSNPYRFADGVLSPDGETFYCVREDHTNPAPKDVVNEIVSVSMKDGSMTVLATGNDFYAAPRLSPDGQQLAYITWSHPNMPWDATQLRLIHLLKKKDDDDDQQQQSSLTKDHELVAGEDGDTSVLQPLWNPKTHQLFYISDESGYYNIYSHGKNILPMDYDFGGASPGWTFGQQGFTFLPEDGRLIATYQKDGQSVLLLTSINDDNDDEQANDIVEYGMDDGLPMKMGGVVVGSNHNLYFLGGSPSTPASVYQWNLDTKQPAKILACSSSLQFSDHVISVPQQVVFPTTLGSAYGYYYAPKNDNYQCTTDQAPPLLVKAHGGPTACTSTAFNAGIQFWTSRGFAVLDVDYGGSTGYGREYRRRLRKSWGIVDIDDVCAGANYLVSQGMADKERLCIDGGSAGGYTTLGALAFRDVFRAGCSLYGIGDLKALAGDTHKFESRYLDGLIGSYPEEKDIYEQRSPINSVDTLSCPILILQGAEDKVVPPNQAKMMHDALLQKGIPTCLKIYDNEQHGFRQAQNIEDALDSELAFFGKIFNIDIADAIELTIDNL